MKISLMAAMSENRVIGSGQDIPWHVKGEQLLFKAMTYNQWLLTGRKTFDSMGKLPDRKYAVITRSEITSDDPDVLYFRSIESALRHLCQLTDHIYVAGGGEIYKALIDQADTVHLSVIHQSVYGDICFPELPNNFHMVFDQHFRSNIDYTYQIWQKG